MPFTHGHALIIGIGSYQYEPRQNVPITVADAEAVATVLRDPQYCGYPAEQVTLLTNANATRDRILAALNDLAARAAPDDTVVIFYSGHGEYSADSTYHLTTHDTRWADYKVAAGTAISQPELLDRLRAVKAQRLLLLINACHAGELSPVLGESEQPFTSGQPLPAHIADAILATGSGRIIITACREHQVSYIGPGPLTIFAQALTSGLRGSGFSGRAGYISVFDLYTHLYFAVTEAVQRQVTPALRQLYRCDTQEPELTVLKGVGPFPVALYRGATTLGDFPADHTPPAGVALREVDPAHSQWVFTQAISGAGAVGIGGSLSNSQIITGNHNTVIQSGRDTIQAGRDVTQIGDFVAGDKITAGNIIGAGIAIGSHAQAIVQQGGDHAAFARVFAAIYAAIKERPEDPNVDKAEMSDTVKKIEQEALKGDQANEQKLTRWLHNLADMANDIFAVTVAALTGPQAAFATVARKVAEKVRKERNDE